jgi:hypothetical protein
MPTSAATLKSLILVNNDFFDMITMFTNCYQTFSFPDGCKSNRVKNVLEAIRALLEDVDSKHARDSIHFISIVSVRAITGCSTTKLEKRWHPTSKWLARIPDVASLTFRGYD